MPAPLAHILNPVDVSPCQANPRPAHLEPQEMSETAVSLVSYKRVPKACTQCRRDKSRCDRARPCDGCVRKGRIDLCLDGCVACRQGRLSCDDNRPCFSCLQDGRECIEDDPAAIAASRKKHKVTATATPSLLRPIKPLPRVHIATPETGRKVACIACRRDNKKCAGGDTCQRCLERGEQCTYVARVPKFIKQRCALCRKKNKKCEHVRPCVHCVRAAVPCIDLPRKGVGRGLRVKRACAGCRADKIQCEEVRPCAGCKRKNIDCVERGCNACLERGTKCATCRRQELFQSEEADSSSSASYTEGENDDMSTPSIPSPSSFPPTALPSLPLDPRNPGNSLPSLSPLQSLGSKHGQTPMRSRSLDTLQRLPGLDDLQQYNRLPRQSFNVGVRPMLPRLPSTPLTHPPELPSFSVGFPPLSLSTSMSHMRTRPTSDGLDD